MVGEIIENMLYKQMVGIYRFSSPLAYSLRFVGAEETGHANANRWNEPNGITGRKSI